MKLTSALIVLISIVFSSSANAADRWCYKDGQSPPCGGLPGKCTKNLDESLGGFIARGSNVSRKLTFHGYRNQATIHQYAQVCQATVSKGATIGNGAMIGSGAVIGVDADIGIRAMVGLYARVGRSATVGDGVIVRNHGLVRDFGVAGDRYQMFRSLQELNSRFEEYKTLIQNKQGITIIARGIDIGEWNDERTRNVGESCFYRISMMKALDNQKKEKQEQLADLNLLQYKTPSEEAEIELLKSQIEELEFATQCPVCYDCLPEKTKLNQTKCNHLFCHECYTQVMRSSDNKKCPLCREKDCNKDVLEIKL